MKNHRTQCALKGSCCGNVTDGIAIAEAVPLGRHPLKGAVVEEKQFDLGDAVADLGIIAPKILAIGESISSENPFSPAALDGLSSILIGEARKIDAIQTELDTYDVRGGKAAE